MSTYFHRYENPHLIMEINKYFFSNIKLIQLVVYMCINITPTYCFLNNFQEPTYAINVSIKKLFINCWVKHFYYEIWKITTNIFPYNINKIQKTERSIHIVLSNIIDSIQHFESNACMIQDSRLITWLWLKNNCVDRPTLTHACFIYIFEFYIEKKKNKHMSMLSL